MARPQLPFQQHKFPQHFGSNGLSDVLHKVSMALGRPDRQAISNSHRRIDHPRALHMTKAVASVHDGKQLDGVEMGSSLELDVHSQSVRMKYCVF